MRVQSLGLAAAVLLWLCLLAPGLALPADKPAPPSDSPLALSQSLFSPAVRAADAEVGEGHYREARDILRKAATPSDPSAEYALAVFLLRGLAHADAKPKGGGPSGPEAAERDNPDFAEGMRFMARAAADGFALAQAGMGWRFELGTVLPRNFQVAYDYYAAAAAQDNASGRRGLARMKSDLGVWVKHKPGRLERKGEDALRTQDDAAAFTAFGKAARAGSAPAMYALGVLYDLGKGHARDLDQAVVWYRRAAEKVYPPAEWAMSRYGAVTTPDQLDWLRKASDHGVTIAKFQLGGAMAKGKFGLPADELGGLQLIRDAADRGDTFAKMVMADVYFAGKPGFAEKDQDRAIRLATEAAQDGNPWAHEVLARLLKARGAR